MRRLSAGMKSLPLSLLVSALAASAALGQEPASPPEVFSFPEELSLVPQAVQEAAAEENAESADVPLGMTAAEEALYRAQIAWIDEDWIAARQYAETAAAAGDVTAAVMAGLIARDGRDLGEPNPQQAASWFSRAAEQEHPLALYEMGRLARREVPGVNDARDWFERAARAGHVPGMVAFALELRESPIPQERVRAREWAERAAREGFPEAMFQYAQLLDLGIGGPQDLVGARSWYERAAAERHAEAALQAGIMWAQGDGGEADDVRARELMRQSAETGFAPAQGQYGLMMYQGRGGSQDIAMASYWFEQGAQGGDSESHFLFAYTLARGEGREVDFERAYFWTRIAATDAFGAPVYDASRDQLEQGLRSVLDAATMARIDAEVAERLAPAD